MFDWLLDLIDDLLDDDDELYEPEPPKRLPNPDFSPKLRIRLENQAPRNWGSQINRRPCPPRPPVVKRPVVPPIWHPSYPNGPNNPNNPNSIRNPFNPMNPNSIRNPNNPMNPNSPLHRGPMNPFGPHHR